MYSMIMFIGPRLEDGGVLEILFLSTISNRAISVQQWSFLISSWNKFSVSSSVFDTIHIACLIELEVGWSHCKAVFSSFLCWLFHVHHSRFNKQFFWFFTIWIGCWCDSFNWEVVSNPSVRSLHWSHYILLWYLWSLVSIWHVVLMPHFWGKLLILHIHTSSSLFLIKPWHFTININCIEIRSLNWISRTLYWLIVVLIFQSL